MWASVFKFIDVLDKNKQQQQKTRKNNNNKNSWDDQTK